MPPRFYVPEARAGESTIELPQDEAAHLTRVLRLGSGDRLRVFNGRGDEWDAHVEEAARHRVIVRLVTRVVPAPEARVAITLAIAVLKGDKMDDIVRDAVMLGVARIQPLVTARTEVAHGALEKGARIARWQRIAVASAKQCGRAVVPVVGRAAEMEDVLREAERSSVMLVEPSVNVPTTTIYTLAPAEHLTLFVGPEGGWTSEEVQAARESGAMLVTLGAHTLRADAVPIVALTALRVRMEDL